ncbi:uncharacterized protein LOC133320010 [Danaus plexippus]|uniref:uncharacterized protein LOC133320010 n=1 Tax=Danaus plexippus TaxID=13037 RepID=UPI002AB27E70|nr:uncharacterized protein LOC133320010 [Danaus plexippus]
MSEDKLGNKKTGPQKKNVPAIYCLNLGLISGDLSRKTNPLIIKKTSHLSPVTINIKSGVSRVPNLPTPLLPRKLSAKPPTSQRKIKRLLKKTSLKRKLLKIPKLRKIPKLPKLPRLPLIPFLPPILPKLPLLPLPLLPIVPPLPLLPPILPRVSKLLKPLRVPIIGKSKLQKALGSELKPVQIPWTGRDARNRKGILEKLLKLRRNGALSAAEFHRFKKLLL